MCCLRYEYDNYRETKARLPAINTNVMTPRGKGKVIGHNTITRDVGGCAVHEHWTSASPKGGAGESLTAFSPFDRRWHQLYVGGGGYILSMSGDFEGDRLVMLVDRGAGATTIERWSWTPLDASRVRQTSAVSTDGGKTWKTQFDGVYERTAR